MGRNYLAVLLALAVTMSMTACGQATAPATSSSASSSNEVSVAQPVAPVTIPISYTDDYLLFEGDELGFTTIGDRTRKLGLMTSDGKVILPAAYTEISISEDGIIFAEEILDQNKPSVYKIFDLAGNRIGKEYSHIQSQTKDIYGNYTVQTTTYTNMAVVPPYVAHTEDASGKRSYWLLDAKGVPQEDRPYDGYVEAQIVDANGKPEPQSIYFIDKDGKRLSEGYKLVELYENEQDLQDKAGDSRIIQHSKIDGNNKPLPEGDNSLPFYICLTQQDKLVRLAYNDMLLKQ